MKFKAHTSLTLTILLLLSLHSTKLLAQTSSGGYEAAIVSRLETKLSSRLPEAGYIEELNIEEGSTVKKDETLVSFDCRSQRAQMDKMRAELTGAKATLTSKQKLQALKSAAEIDVILAQVEVKKLQAEQESMEALLDACVIKAPTDGIITELFVDQFQTVQHGEPVLSIIANHNLRIEFYVPSSQMAKFKEGTTLSLKVNETSETFNVKTLFVIPRIDPVSQTFKVIGEIETSTDTLLPGMTGVISLN